MEFTEDTLQDLKRMRSALINVREIHYPNADDEPVLEGADGALEHARDMLASVREELEEYQEYAEEHDPNPKSSTEERLQEEVERWERKVKSLRWSEKTLRRSFFTNEDTIGSALEALDDDIRRLSSYLS